VLLDVKVYEKHHPVENLAKLLAPAEQDVEHGRTRSAREFVKGFKSARKIPG
jgi:hypothetical protein